MIKRITFMRNWSVYNDKFSTCRVEILLGGGFSTKVETENIFKPTTGDESLHEIMIMWLE
jgi:hypothetical protein